MLFVCLFSSLIDFFKYTGSSPDKYTLANYEQIKKIIIDNEPIENNTLHEMKVIEETKLTAFTLRDIFRSMVHVNLK